MEARPQRHDDGPADHVVRLDPDHPGFRDGAYRRRRDEIARIARTYVGGPVPDASYTEAEHGVWRWVCAGLAPLREQHACRGLTQAWRELDLSPDRIPQLREVNERIQPKTGFRLEPAAGLISPVIFLSSLEDSVFPSTQYIRHHSTPAYTPEPDIVHELTGHAVQLAEPRLARLNRRFGQVAASLTSADALQRLCRVYWFTIEFGLLLEDGHIKAYGAGILSSSGELRHLAHATVLPFDLARIETQDYDVTRFQDPLFCAASVEHVLEQLDAYLDHSGG